MSFLSFLSGLGVIPEDWRIARTKVQDLINQTPELLSIQYCAGGTSSTLFAALWSPYNCPQNAMVMEGTNLWVTTDGGTSWGAPTLSAYTTGDVILWESDTIKTGGWKFLDGGAEDIATYSALSTHLSSRDIRRDIVMSVWTSTSQATFSITRGIRNLANADTVNIYWNSGANSRLGMAVSSASSSSMVVSGGSGDNLPNSVGGSFEFKFSATKFLLPDRRGASLLVKDNMGGVSANTVTSAQADTLNGRSGSETHTLTVAEMPSHAHKLGAAAGNATNDVTAALSFLYDAGAPIIYSANAPSAQPYDVIPAIGGGGSHNNMHPYTTINLIIKT